MCRSHGRGGYSPAMSRGCAHYAMDTLPAKLQRELFDDAGDMGELLDTSALRGQIARFLHTHKNDEQRR